jgi:hypothetical protein
LLLQSSGDGTITFCASTNLTNGYVDYGSTIDIPLTPKGWKYYIYKGSDVVFPSSNIHYGFKYTGQTVLQSDDTFNEQVVRHYVSATDNYTTPNIGNVRYLKASMIHNTTKQWQ